MRRLLHQSCWFNALPEDFSCSLTKSELPAMLTVSTMDVAVGGHAKNNHLLFICKLFCWNHLKTA